MNTDSNLKKKTLIEKKEFSIYDCFKSLLNKQSEERSQRIDKNQKLNKKQREEKERDLRRKNINTCYANILDKHLEKKQLQGPKLSKDILLSRLKTQENLRKEVIQKVSSSTY